MNAIEVNGISRAYPGFLLDHISFSLPTGTILGLVGENGAGKSTLMKLILGMIRADSGSVSVLGYNDLRANPKIREDLGVVMDESCFPAVMKAAEIGTMKVTEQIDALQVMATSPTQYLVAPRFIAIVLMMPVLVIYGNVVGDIGGGFVAMNYAGIGSHMFTESIRGFIEAWDIIGGLIKGAVFGAIIAIIGCHKGLNAQQGAEGVGRATTASVVLSIILIFIFNYFLSVILFVHGG